MARVRLELSGVVQGVGFRAFARDLARRMDLAGWVRNRESGSVELAVEGDDASVAAFLARVERGPAGALVEESRTLPADGLGPLPRPFAILR